MKITFETAKIVNVAMRNTKGETETFPVDITKMSDLAIAHCLSNGIQRFCNDAANNVANGAEGGEKDNIKRETIADKISKLTSETFTVGARGASVDIWTREARAYLADQPKVKAAIADMKAAERNATLDGLIEKHHDAIKKQVDTRVAAMTAKLDIDLEL